MPLARVETEVESSTDFITDTMALIGISTNVHDRHITVAQVHCANDGDDVAHVIVQPSEKRVSIAEWNEYMQTSGTDIAVTSNLTTIF